MFLLGSSLPLTGEAVSRWCKNVFWGDGEVLVSFFDFGPLAHNYPFRFSLPPPCSFHFFPYLILIPSLLSHIYIYFFFRVKNVKEMGKDDFHH